MCRHSLEGYAHFRAEDGDKIVVDGSPRGHAVGFYGDKPATAGHRYAIPGKAMACVLVGQKLTLSKVDVYNVAAGYRFAGTFYAASLSQYVGQDVVVEVTCLNDPTGSRGYPREYADAVRLPDGTMCLFANLKPGVEGFVGVKPSLDEKLGLTTMAQVAGENAADPEPKPNTDDEKPTETDTPAPVEEPQAAY